MEKYLQYFYEIAEIPHGSGNTGYIRNYLKDFAEREGLARYEDEGGNLIVVKEASPGKEDLPPVILQGHMDMVAVKEPSCPKDLSSEGLTLVTEGDDLYAEGTSLGGDDGIAVAYMLALLAGDYQTPRLECVFTSDEETGMLGATALDVSPLTGKRMINLDQEEEGIFIAGCAGGVRATLRIPTEKQIFGGPIFTLYVAGLPGGHSGIDIDKNRGNAIKEVIGELCKLNANYGINLIEISGGEADNVIPKEATARFMLTGDSDNPVFIDRILNTRGRHLSVTYQKDNEMIALDSEDTTRVLDFLGALPDGVMGRMADNPSFVETSLNTGVIVSGEEDITLTMLLRSSSDFSKKLLVSDLCKLVEQCGATVTFAGDYPGWCYEERSPLREHMTRIYEKRFGFPPEVTVIHAGLECGIFAGKIPGLDCVSIGPTVRNIHTVKECMSLSSAQRMFEYVVEVLESF